MVELLERLDDDRAVSPVIGVILMVAITVILAAVIGAFVLGLGDQVQETSPHAQISITNATEGGDTVTFAHGGGDSFTDQNTNELRVTVNGAEYGSVNPTDNASDFPFQAGNEITIEGETLNEDDTVRVVWVGQDRSSVIATRQV